MTTKHKIIAGFVCMMVILATVSFSGYSYLDKSIDGLLEYRRLARMNVRTSDAMASMNAAATAANMYLLSRDPDAVTAATDFLKEMDGSIAAAQKEMSIQGNLANAERIRELGRAYGNDLNKLRDLMRIAVGQYQDKVVPDSRTMNDAFHSVAENAAANNNSELLLIMEKAWSEYAFMLSALGRFYYGRAEADRAIIEQRITAMKPLLQKMESLIISPAVREVYTTRLKPAADSVFAAAASLIRATGDADKVIADIRASRAAIGKALPELSAHYDQRMNKGGTAITAESRDGQKMLLAGSALGLLLGLGLAAFILYGLIRVLRETGNMAKAVARGDFSYAADIKEGGEIGSMVADIRQIPSVLQSILDDYTKLAKKIEDGELDAKGDPAAYQGGFATLVAGTNAILDRFTQLLDSLPSPVLVFDRECRVAYMNASGRSLGGENYKGKTDKQISNRDDADTAYDALRTAASTLQAASSETVARPQGRNMDISYTVIPMLNNERKLSSLLELITDLTAIKETQRKIQHVAEQAASISSRVAAASEQLSAQVEQVSRGAEMQRTRVENTASAMTEMNSTVLEVARNAGQASEQSERTKDKANDGAALVDNVVRSINQVNQVASTLQTNMRDLGDQAESIGGVINVISDIADQTNLLALNAAIEAARAGEAGRGFAVVADEVRKLAEKTMSATQEVGANIKAIQNSTRTSIEEVDTAAVAVAEATGLANTSGQALSEIVSLASANSSVVASIATAAEQQSATSEEINRAIEEINQIVSETTDGMVQSSAAVQELAIMAQELNTVMVELQ